MMYSQTILQFFFFKASANIYANWDDYDHISNSALTHCCVEDENSWSWFGMNNFDQCKARCDTSEKCVAIQIGNSGCHSCQRKLILKECENYKDYTAEIHYKKALINIHCDTMEEYVKTKERGKVGGSIY